MNAFLVPWVVVALLAAVLILTGGRTAGAQATQQTQQPPKTYQPEVGQAGKDVVWVPTSDSLVARMLQIGKVTAKDYVIDLGSGDGRTVIAAARLGARAHGIEYNPDMVALSKQNAVTAGVASRATFEKADLFESDFSRATVITMFLLPSINVKLRPKLLDLKPGTRIVSNTFTMEDWQADETATVEDGCTSWCTALLWIIPAKAAGTWQLPQGELVLAQTYQMLSGSLRTAKGSQAVSEGRMHGEEISFTVGGSRYTGRVTGPVMEGTVTSGTTRRPFKASKVASQK